MTNEVKDRAKFFYENYDVIANIVPSMILGKKYICDPIIDGHKICRFCGKDETATKFKEDAHAISAMLGNKTVFLKNQCVKCNHFFGEFVEDGLAKYLGIARTISQIPKRKGYPSYKSKDGKFRMDIIECGTVIQTTSDSGISSLHDTYIDFETDREPYYPIDAYRTLVLSALSVLPFDEMPPLVKDYIWLRADRKTLEGKQILDECHDFIIQYASQVIETFVPGPNPLPLRVVVARRKKGSITNVPYCFGVIQFHNYRFQFLIPSELDMAGKYTMKSYVGDEEIFPGYEDFISNYGVPDVKIVDLSNHEKVFGEKIIRRVSFEYKREVGIEDAKQYLKTHNLKQLEPEN